MSLNMETVVARWEINNFSLSSINVAALFFHLMKKKGLIMCFFNKVIFCLLSLAYCNTVYANTVNVTLLDMFSDYKENEYAFEKKYSDKELVFNAIVASIDPACHTQIIDWDANTKDIPCAKLYAPDGKVGFWGIEVPIANAVMKEEDTLLELKRDQKIILHCELDLEIGLSFENLNFKNCILVK